MKLLTTRLTEAVRSISQEYDADLYEEALDEIISLYDDQALTGRRLDNQSVRIAELVADIEKLEAEVRNWRYHYG